MLFDSHAHINNDNYTEQTRAALINEIEASDLSYVMDIGSVSYTHLFDAESTTALMSFKT